MKQQFLYRGIPANHPAMAAALRGEVVPGNIQSNLTPEEHNLGGQQANSPFTSWTRDRSVAERYAKRFGPGGIILRLPAQAPQPGDSWRWEWSPDIYGEAEVLLRGFASGATVEKI